ncbi:rhodanese-like domain-containing protein [bacterium AH-315-G05]|nr:rhodanese-like domain-containing protein [bacterium AH-315-G05]
MVMSETLIGCTAISQKEGSYIITARTAIELISDDNVVIIDTQDLSAFAKQHVEGAININKDDIVIS